MNKLRYPFIVVTTTETDLALPVVPQGAPCYVAAFSSIEKATAYMMAQGKTLWQIKLVSRPTMASFKESLCRLGVRGFAFNPVGEHRANCSISMTSAFFNESDALGSRLPRPDGSSWTPLSRLI